MKYSFSPVKIKMLSALYHFFLTKKTAFQKSFFEKLSVSGIAALFLNFT